MWIKFFLLNFVGVLALETSAPIIGILTQETYILQHLLDKFDRNESFIGASYVKFLEMAGGRVIPVWIGQDEDYYQRVLNYTNGLLLPGGGTYFTEPKGYGQATKILFKLALESNQNGKYYPIWGTCLGMQALLYGQLGNDVRINSTLKNTAIPLNFKPDFRDARLFKHASDEIINILKSKNVTYNYHRFGLTEKVLKENNVQNFWHVLSTNVDIYDLEFISSMEANEYPFYGVQFHPEKNAFEFRAHHGLPHNLDAVKATQYFANFFVEECRKNKNQFPSAEMERNSLIYNYQMKYTGIKPNASYEQIYLFTAKDYENNLL